MKSDFFGGLAPRTDKNSVYRLRRKELVTAIKEQYADVKDGIIVLYAAFENSDDRFRQDKTFYYYTGLNEPAAVLVIDFSEKSTIYIPNYYKKRSQWMVISQDLIVGNAKAFGVDAIEFLGNECSGYELDTFFSVHDYKNVISLIKDTIACKGTLFTTIPQNGHEYINSRLVMSHLYTFIPELYSISIDISHFIAQARRRKDVGEVESVYRAVEITELAHEAAIQAIKNGVLESEVQAALEYIMIAASARPAFPSIVASGKNSTVLHYNENKDTMRNGDLVLVDIGAEFNNYCADLTRTYPVSGAFTKRQRELYTIVLKTQEYIAERAKPGIWLRNNNKPQESLHHIAHKFITDRGYGDYFPHGIGHFLGLNVHDVGDVTVPLQEGDVITIEPGIYIAAESIGIRIEDNYWITKDGAVCLSEDLPKEADDIEEIMQQALSGEDDESEDEDYYDDEDEDDEEYN